MEDQAKVPQVEHVVLAQGIDPGEFGLIVGSVSSELAGTRQDGKNHKLEFNADDSGMTVVVDGEMVVKAERVVDTVDQSVTYNVTGDPKFKQSFTDIGF